MPKQNIAVSKESGRSDVVHLIRGDQRTTIIRMNMKRWNDGVDLSGLEWKINVINAAKEEEVFSPSAGIEITDTDISVDWKPYGMATAHEGQTKYQLIGTGFDENGKPMECRFAPNIILVGCRRGDNHA